MSNRSPLDYLDRFVSRTAKAGVLHCAAEDEALSGRTVRIRGRDRVHFGSCSYLGLEFDPRLQQAACEAVKRYGTQFSSSRSYLSAPLYADLEERLATLLGGSVLVTPSTTLGHLAALPALVEGRDAVLMDHQVHHSVQTAVQVARREGCHVELVRHGRLDELEERVVALAPHHRRVWILADGVYSMFGDLAPVEFLWELAERTENLWLYIDDAHGMGWCGPRGCGSVLSRVPLHERVIVATSLNKSFAAGGGCLVFGDPESRRRVFTVGGPMIFAGPVQPPMLGVAIASADLHLGNELPRLQEELRWRIDLVTRRLDALQLPLVAHDMTPIRFIGVGLPRVARNLAARLLDEGWFVNVSHFPAVPMKQAGIRFTVTRHHQEEDLEGLADALARHFEPAFKEEGQSPEPVWRTFELEPPATRTPRRVRGHHEIEVVDTIADIDSEEWNAALGHRGIFSWRGLRFLEDCFGPGSGAPDPWRFRYMLGRDNRGQLALASFFTLARWKLDMLEDEAVSREVERRRVETPGLLTGPVLSMGSLLTVGNHLFIDDTLLPTGSPAWEKMLAALLTRVREFAESDRAVWLVLRDLPPSPPLEDLLTGHGFVRRDAPVRYVAQIEEDDEKQWGGLNKKRRYFLRNEVKPWNDAYRLEVVDGSSPPMSEKLLQCLRELYCQVHEGSREINTFPLPAHFFERCLAHPDWELMLLRSRTEAPDAPPLAVMACFRGIDRYCAPVIGLDYAHVRTRGLYRQCLRWMFLRARALALPVLSIGMGAGLQKRRFGAQPIRSDIYVQAEDHYALDVLAQIKAELGVSSA